MELLAHTRPYAPREFPRSKVRLRLIDDHAILRDGLRSLLRASPHLRVMVLTVHNTQEWLRAALHAGAHAFVSKDELYHILLGTIRALVARDAGAGPRRPRARQRPTPSAREGDGGRRVDLSRAAGAHRRGAGLFEQGNRRHAQSQREDHRQASLQYDAQALPAGRLGGHALRDRARLLVRGRRVAAAAPRPTSERMLPMCPVGHNAVFRAILRAHSLLGCYSMPENKKIGFAEHGSHLA